MLNKYYRHQGDYPRPTLPASTRLRRLLEDPNCFLACPGVYDGFSARIALEIGFDCLYMVCYLAPAYEAYQS